MAPQVDDKSPTEKRTVSIRKVEANRQNALKSTGPRTPRGKAHSRAKPSCLFFAIVPAGLKPTVQWCEENQHEPGKWNCGYLDRDPG
jgi:hypothetical protein